MKRVALTDEQANQYIESRKQSPCFVCKIVDEKTRNSKEHILFEDNEVIVFFPLFPTHFGQVLVAPRRHVEHVFEDLSRDEYLYLQKIVHKIGEAVQHALEPERIYVASFGSQQLNRHVHFHILPLPKDVPIKEQQMASMMPEVVGRLELSEDEWQELTKKIRDKL